MNDEAKTISIAVEEAVRHCLSANEEIRWIGLPSPSITLTTYDIFFTLFGAICMLFIIVWEGLVTYATFQLIAHQPSILFLHVFGLIFFFISVYMMVGRYYYRKHKKRHLSYAITSKRALILEDFKLVRSIYLSSVLAISLQEHSGGIGHIHFLDPTNSTWRFSQDGWPIDPSRDCNISFLDVPRARDVYTVALSVKMALLEGTEGPT